MQASTNTSPLAVVQRIQRAVNEHDLDALGECFDLDYQSEQPMRPDHAFRGREQMRKNWTQIFGAVPDIHAEVLRCAVDGDTIWTEWDLQGTQRDGSPWHSVMITIAGVQHDQVAWMRLFMDVVRTGDDIDAAVRADLSGSSRSR
jgi:limonene-1,2-epoxide hydrolase